MTTPPVEFDKGALVYRRDGWICRYCSVDGKTSFANWRALTWDHLLPEGSARRDDHEFIVTACSSCNELLARFFDHARRANLNLESFSPEQLVAMRLEHIQERVAEYHRYWLTHVAPFAEPSIGSVRR